MSYVQNKRSRAAAVSGFMASLKNMVSGGTLIKPVLPPAMTLPPAAALTPVPEPVPTSPESALNPTIVKIAIGAAVLGGAVLLLRRRK